MQINKKGWKKEKRNSLARPAVTEVAYIFVKEDGSSFAVVADHTGVVLRGESQKFTQEGGSATDDFAWVFADAMREYMKLKRARIVTL